VRGVNRGAAGLGADPLRQAPPHGVMAMSCVPRPYRHGPFSASLYALRTLYLRGAHVGVVLANLSRQSRHSLQHGLAKRHHPHAAPSRMSAHQRVWRMTAQNPQGEFVESALKPAKTAPRTAVRWYQTEIRLTSRAELPSQDELAGVEPSGEERARLLSPAKVPNWQASSHDLATGLTVDDFTDTVPGELYDQMFRGKG